MSIKADNGNEINTKAAKQQLWKFLKYKKADRGELLHRVLTHCQQLLMIECKKYH
jgi:hypothetical protein